MNQKEVNDLVERVHDLHELQQRARSLPFFDRWRVMQTWKDKFLDAQLTENLGSKIFSHAFLLLMFTPVTAFLIWIVVVEGVRFFPFYLLITCGVFLIPVFSFDLMRMMRLRRERRKKLS